MEKDKNRKITLFIRLINMLLIVVLLNFLTCCSRDVNTPINTKVVQHKQDKNKFVEEAKKELNNQLKEIGKENRFIGEPDWDNCAFSPSDDRNNILLVPLRNYEVNVSFTKSMNPKGFRHLVFSKVSSAQTNIEIVELHPDSPDNIYLNGKDFSKSFSGYLLTYSLENNLVQGHHRTLGKADKLVKVPNTIFENAN